MFDKIGKWYLDWVKRKFTVNVEEVTHLHVTLPWIHLTTLLFLVLGLSFTNVFDLNVFFNILVLVGVPYAFICFTLMILTDRASLYRTNKWGSMAFGEAECIKRRREELMNLEKPKKKKKGLFESLFG